MAIPVEILPGVPKACRELLAQIKGHKGQRSPLEALGVAARPYRNVRAEVDHGLVPGFELVHDGRLAAVGEADDHDVGIVSVAAQKGC